MKLPVLITAASLLLFLCLRKGKYSVSASTTTEQVSQKASRISSQSDFSVLPAVLEKILPYDKDRFIYSCPPEPSPSIINSLLFTIKSNAEKLSLISFMVRQYSHYDPVSIKMFRNLIETLVNLADLHKSIKLVESESYSPVLVSIKGMVRCLLKFLRTFTSSLLISRLSESSVFKTILLNPKNLDGMFHVLGNCVEAEQAEILIDAIFSAVDCIEEETLAWSFYLKTATPSNCVMLPLEYLTSAQQQHQQILPNLADQIIKIFDSESEGPFDDFWLTQLGFLIRLRLLSQEEILKIAEKMSKHSGSSRKSMNLGNFIRLTFLDELARPKCPKTAWNHTPERPISPASAEFYIKLWNLIVAGNGAFNDNEDFVNFFSSVLQSLEADFPGITEELSVDDLSMAHSDNEDALKTLNFITAITSVSLELSSAGEIQKVIDFVEKVIGPEISQVTLLNIRFRLRLIYDKLLNIIEAIENCEAEDPTLLKTLIQAVAQQLGQLKNGLKFFTPITQADEVKVLVDFAFKLDNFLILEAETVIDLVLARVESNETLLRLLFTKIAENLSFRPDFFCLKLDHDHFGHLSTEIVSEFLHNITQAQLNDNSLAFYINAYLNGIMDREFTLAFIERLGTANLARISESTWNSLVGGLSEISYFKFKDDSLEFLNNKLADSQIYSVKLFTSLANRSEIFSSGKGFESSIIPWLCAKLSAFESLKFPSSRVKQLESLNLSADLDKNTESCLEIIRKFFLNGATKSDLKAAMKFVIKLRDSVIKSGNRQFKLNLLISASFCLIANILRTDDSVISAEQAETFMAHFDMATFKVFAPQIIFKALKNTQMRTALLPTLFRISFDQPGHGILLDPETFSGISPQVIKTHLNIILMETFSPHRIDLLRLESICFWIAQGGIVPVEVVKDLLEKIEKSTHKPIIIKLAVALIRAVFKFPEYGSLRQLAVRVLFIEVDHTYIFPRPLAMGTIGGVADLFNKPEFLEAVREHVGQNTLDILAMTKTELKRVNRVTADTLNLSDGIENVLQTYVLALRQLASFEMTLNRKIVLLDSINRSLGRLISSEGHNDTLGIEPADNNLDYFVRTAIHLAVQIYSDFSGPTLMSYLDEETLVILLTAITLFVRDSNVQSLLVFHMFAAIRERTESREAILKLVPQFINWRRFLLLPDTFRYIFGFIESPESFDTFISDVINFAFCFDDFHTSEAVDFSRDERQAAMLHDGFFFTMSHLVTEYNLPAKFILKILTFMNSSPNRIEVISSHLVAFLYAILQPRPVDPLSRNFRITANCYGSAQSAQGVDNKSQKEIISGVLKFLENRPDFLGLSLVHQSDSQVFQFIYKLEKVAKFYPNFQSAPIKLIYAIFNFSPASSLSDILQLIERVPLPQHSLRSLAMWLILSFSSVTSEASAVPVASMALSLVPKSFESREAFLDMTISQSWFEISSALIDWIRNVSSAEPRIFARHLDENSVERFLTVLLWKLEFDGREERVFGALFAFMNSLAFTTEPVKYRAIHLFGQEIYRPLMTEIRKLNSSFEPFCSILRKCTNLNGNLAKAVEKLTWKFLDGPITVNEETVMATRTKFIEHLQKVETVVVSDTAELPGLLAFLCEHVEQLRLMHEIDLILKFIEVLGGLARKFYSQTKTGETVNLAMSMQITLIFLRQELLLQSNSAIFIEFFRFFFKHSTAEKKSEHFEIIALLLNQIRGTNHIQSVLGCIITDLQLDSCLVASSGFPKHFYEEDGLLSFFIESYLIKLNALGIIHRQESRVGMDGFHFIFLFNCIHNSNGSDELFHSWINNVSRIHDNDMLTDTFAHNLKAHCFKRKHLIDVLIPIYINPCFITKVFSSAAISCRDDLIAVFKLMLMNNVALYQSKVELLPENLRKLMNQHVGASYLEKKRKLVQDLVLKCNLPAEFQASDPIPKDLQKNLETLIKLDFSVLLSEHFTIFFRRLGILVDGLLNRPATPKSFENLQLASFALAVQLKNQQAFNSQVLLTVLRNQSSLNLSEEVSYLILKATAVLPLQFSTTDAAAIALAVLKSSHCNQVLLNLFNNPELKSHVTLMLKTILQSKPSTVRLQIDLIVQKILWERVKTEKAAAVELFDLAVEHELLPKTVELIFERILK